MQGFVGLTQMHRHTSLQRMAVPGIPGSGGKMQAFFMGKRVDWQPGLGVASKAVEVGGELPLGIRFERQDGTSECSSKACPFPC